MNVSRLSDLAFLISLGWTVELCFQGALDTPVYADNCLWVLSYGPSLDLFVR